MGKRGTDVAREASAIVLLDDDFRSIVQSVRLGRRIYDNIRKAMGFIFAVHVPIAGLALLPLFFGMPILFGPIHIALLEMVIDPVCALVFEAEGEEADVMARKPRDPAMPMFSRPVRSISKPAPSSSRKRVMCWTMASSIARSPASSKYTGITSMPHEWLMTSWPSSASLRTVA